MKATRIKRHKKSHIVELGDGSVWHIWPGDLAKTLGWLPTTDLEIISIRHAICSHALVNRSDRSLVKASPTGNEWPIDVVRELLRIDNQAAFE